jgi:diguanylate cyclase
VLRTVASRLAGAVRASDTVCRLGGDEFVVVLTDLARPEDADRLAGQLLDRLRAPIGLDGIELQVSASAGVAVSPGGTGVGELFREADVAMYRAKQQGIGHLRFDTTRDDARLHRIALAADLQQAIGADELFLRYQPKIDLSDGRTVGLEGLARWQHPARGAIPPSDFIPMAEATGAITSLSAWVLRTAVKECRGWTTGSRAPTVAVNLSAPMLHDPELPSLVASALHEAGLDPPRLELEITESAIMADPDAAQAVMRRMVDTGVSFAIDDFGTGYSSLAYLKRLPVRAIKIDRTFISDLISDERDAAIVRSVIDLAHHLGLEVVAEGVETDAVRRRLGDLGCDAAQGYLFARPLPAGDVERWLCAPAGA